MQSTTLMELVDAKEHHTILNVYQDYPIDMIAQAAEVLRDRDFYNIALPLYQYLLQRQEMAEFYYGIGQCYGKAYDCETSLTYLRQAFQLQPDRTEGTNYYAYILEKNLLMDQAEQWYHKALSNGYADDLWTLSHYAYFLEKNHQLNAAEHTYQDVLQRNPTYTWAMKRCALLMLKRNQPDRSVDLMKTAIEQHPKNPFVQLNYLEYLIICGDGATYEAHLRSLDYPQLVLPFQTLIDLFDYFWRYLLQGHSNPEKLIAYQQKVAALKDSIHRDFDDLNELLITNDGDLETWKQMTHLLVK